MIEEEVVAMLDLEALRGAIEGRDPDLLLGYYADDATLRVVYGGSDEGAAAFRLCGKGDIERYLRVVFGQTTSGHVDVEVLEKDLAMYSEACEYPDGTRVVVNTTLGLRNGKISHQLDIVERSP